MEKDPSFYTSEKVKEDFSNIFENVSQPLLFWYRKGRKNTGFKGIEEKLSIEIPEESLNRLIKALEDNYVLPEGLDIQQWYIKIWKSESRIGVVQSIDFFGIKSESIDSPYEISLQKTFDEEYYIQMYQLGTEQIERFEIKDDITSAVLEIVQFTE